MAVFQDRWFLFTVPIAHASLSSLHKRNVDLKTRQFIV